MAEYIERIELIEEMKRNSLKMFNSYYKGYVEAIKDVADFKSADVQPIDRWISVEDRLPDKYGWYLVMAHNRVRAYEWSIEGWYNERDLPVDDRIVTYWQPLPEPPKDGDAE